MLCQLEASPRLYVLKNNEWTLVNTYMLLDTHKRPKLRLTAATHTFRISLNSGVSCKLRTNIYSLSTLYIHPTSVCCTPGSLIQTVAFHLKECRKNPLKDTYPATPDSYHKVRYETSTLAFQIISQQQGRGGVSNANIATLCQKNKHKKKSTGHQS